MFHKLFFKIWIVIFLAFVAAIVAIFLLVDWGIKKEFYHYANRQILKNVHQLEREIRREYRQAGSLEHFRNNDPHWNALKRDAFDIAPPPPPRRDGSERKKFKKPNRYHRFVGDVVLVDAAKNTLVGRANKRSEYDWQKIQVNEITIGYIGYLPLRNLVRDSDQQFLDRYGKRLLFLSPLILAFSALVAVWISRYITVPIKRLSGQTEQLAGGDYSVQVPVNSRDEIGDLCRNFNELAHTLNTNQTMRNQWVADISHEMRTPVAVLKAQIESMLDGIRPMDQKQLSIIAEKIEDLRKLVDDLFELSLADSGSLTYHKEHVPLQEIMDPTVHWHSPLFEQYSLRFHYDFSFGKNTRIYADIKRLRQLMDNVLENARRYTNSGGEVLLKVQTQSNTLRITVSDSAPTVPVEKLDKIFERLYRAEDSRSRETGGAGLGLAICKNIVAAHQGRIYAQQSALGGLDIIIELPLS